MPPDISLFGDLLRISGVSVKVSEVQIRVCCHLVVLRQAHAVVSFKGLHGD